MFKEGRCLSYYQTFLLWYSFEINDNFVLLYKISKNIGEVKVLIEEKSRRGCDGGVESLIIVYKRRRDRNE